MAKERSQALQQSILALDNWISQVENTLGSEQPQREESSPLNQKLDSLKVSIKGYIEEDWKNNAEILSK